MPIIAGEDVAESYQQQKEAASRSNPEADASTSTEAQRGGDGRAEDSLRGGPTAAPPPQPDSPGVFYEGVVGHQHPHKGEVRHQQSGSSLYLGKGGGESSEFLSLSFSVIDEVAVGHHRPQVGEVRQHHSGD